LSRRGVVLLNNLFVFCDESINHLFFNCKITWLFWGMYYNWLGVSTVNHYDAKSHFMHNRIHFLMLRTIEFWVYLDSNNRGDLET